MSIPNPDLGPFEGENEAWCRHVTKQFMHEVTTPILVARECSPSHAAIAFMHGFVNFAFEDAMERGDGEQQIMPDVLERVWPLIEGLKNSTVIAVVADRPHSRLTVLPGGKT
ncbi:hypothetical protein [Mesorhizobium sp. B1-1-7]|uniref:hypothetical protein n=1 Tax=Mesorhizobium sp. B1-1-7 TaxID=2589977 RepID=UPI00112BA27A|nr:hypothetical protein [Mesorhizobium sp. B1-1-7]TPN49347.1 hypothetical protein FJ978_19310 [Mesorhizobium sp. B1-1-7]